MPVKLKGKTYRTVVRPPLLCGEKTWSTTKNQEKRPEVNERRMVLWMCGVTKKDKSFEKFSQINVAPVAKKITEKMIKWYGHVKRRDKAQVLRRMVDEPVPGKIQRGRQESRWKDSCKRYTKSMGLKDALDRT